MQVLGQAVICDPLLDVLKLFFRDTHRIPKGANFLLNITGGNLAFDRLDSCAIEYIAGTNNDTGGSTDTKQGDIFNDYSLILLQSHPQSVCQWPLWPGRHHPR